jgi:hypothetical protein
MNDGTIVVSLGHVLSFAGLLIAVMGALMRLLMSAHEKRIEEKFDSINKAQERERERGEANHVALLELQARLPRDYVLREDYMRNQIILESKLNEVSGKFDSLLLRITNHE